MSSTATSLTPTSASPGPAVEMLDAQASSSATRVPPVLPSGPWIPIYAAELVTNIGCGGADFGPLVLARTPHTRDQLEALWAAQRDACKAADRAWADAHPLPERAYANSPWTESTWGAERAARARREAEHKAWYAGQRVVREAAERDAWEGAELSVASAGRMSHIMTHGLDYQDDEVVGPMAVLHDQGCRCMCGGVWYDDFEGGGQKAGMAALLVENERTFIVFPELDGTWPDIVTDPGALAALEERAQRAEAEALAQEQAEAEARVWARSVRAEEVDAMGYEEYTRWSKLRPGGVVGLGGTRDVDVVRDEAAWEVRAQKVAHGVRGAAGLHELWIEIDGAGVASIG